MFKFKKFKVLAAMAVVFMIVIAATPSTLKRQLWNAVQFFKQGIYIGATNQTYFDRDGSASLADGNLVYNTSGRITTEAGETPTDYINLPIGAHTATDGEITAGTGSTGGVVETNNPVIELQNGVPTITWLDDSRIAKQAVTFRVPANYYSTPVLTLFASSEDSATLATPLIDYELFINSTGEAEDIAAFDNHTIPLAGVASTPEDVNLTIATVDVAAISVGKWMTVLYWRAYDGVGTYKLRSRGLTFSYLKKH